MDVAERWGLPAGFKPVRYPITEEVKGVLRDLLGPNEPVIVTLSNEGNTITLIATPQRLFTVRSGTVGGSGITGANVREFPWEGITKLILQPAALNVKIAIHFRSKDGRTVEVGRRAAMANDAVDNVMPFESAPGSEAFEAIYNIWEHKVPQTGPLG